MRNSFMFRVLVALSIVGVFAVAASATFRYINEKALLTENFHLRAQEDSRVIADYATTPTYNLSTEELLIIFDTELKKSWLLGLSVVDPSGAVTGKIKDGSGGFLDAKHTDFSKRTDIALEVITNRMERDQEYVGDLKVYVDGSDYRNQVSDLRSSKIVEGIFTAIVLVAIVVLVVFILIRIILKQIIGEVKRIETQINEGDLNIKLDQSKITNEFLPLTHTIETVVSSLKLPLRASMEVMKKLSEKDLTVTMDGDFKGEFAQFKDDINTACSSLAGTLEVVRDTVGRVRGGASELSRSAQSLAESNTQQAASLQETSSSLVEIDTQAKQNAEHSNQVVTLTNESMDIIEKAVAQMTQLAESVANIDKSSQEVSKIMKVIDEIAFQTNLLSLNAAVEAARAGKYGKGFAVVADEVRNLAGRSAEAAKTTAEMIENSVKEVEIGVHNSEKTREILNLVNESIKKVKDLSREVNEGALNQSNAIGEINNAFDQMNISVQRNSSISEETASASQDLSGDAGQLKEIVQTFKFGEETELDEPEVEVIPTTVRQLTL